MGPRYVLSLGISSAVVAKDVCFAYRAGAPILRNISFELPVGESLAIVGGSGLGKTTLLRLVDGSLISASGHLEVCGQSLDDLSAKKRLALRRNNLGLVFQSPHLIPELSVLENVMLPALFAKSSGQEAKARALELLEQVEVDPNIEVAALSGGQACRVGVARALIGDPLLVVADEPTASLDPDLAQTVISLLLDTCKDKRALLLVTHDPKIADRCSHLARLLPSTDGGATLEQLR